VRELVVSNEALFDLPERKTIKRLVDERIFRATCRSDTVQKAVLERLGDADDDVVEARVIVRNSQELVIDDDGSSLVNDE
jgi:hypothetical protein